MHLINGLPWIDLEPYADLDALELDRWRFALAIAKNPALIFTSIVGTQLNLYDQGETELGDFAKRTHRQNEKDKEAYSQLESMARFYTYCKYMYPTQGLGQCMHIRTVKNDLYNKKHLRDFCTDTPAAKSFEFFFQWLDRQQIFSEYGRAILFINEPGTSTTLHRDYPFPTSYKNQFVWITLGKTKNFFIQEDNGSKHYVTSRCALFDNANWHGSDPCKYASWSLRVDGVFSPQFLDKSGLLEHFKPKTAE